MTIVSPFNLTSAFKAIGYVLIGLTLVWVAISLTLFGDVLLTNWLAGVILTLGIGGGLLYYRLRAHLTLRYDERGFQLWAGRVKAAAGQWGHFNQVSLAHRGYGLFSVRLYITRAQQIDLPASELKLDPLKLRAQVTGLIAAAAAESQQPSEAQPTKIP